MRRTPRFVAQIALLPVLFALSAADGNMFEIAVGVAILVIWPISVAVAVILVWLARTDPTIASLADAADNAVSTALGMTALAVVGLAAIGRVLGLVPTQIAQQAVILLGWAIIVFLIPTLTYARALRNVWLPMLRNRMDRRTPER